MDKFYFGGDDIVHVDEVSPKVRMIVETTDAILAKKRENQGQIIVTLFESCNLSCKFCNQDHGDTVGMDNVRGKVADTIKAIELMQKMRKTHFSINIMGGEIFQDHFPDSLIADYKYLVEEVNAWASQREIPIKFHFISNLVHFNTNRVKTLIDSLKQQTIQVGLITSYDPSMRFSAADLIVFRKNVELYRDYIVIANVILTAPNIRKFMSGQIPHFDFLYENFEIFFDYYTPEKNFEVMQPKDSDLRDMFEFLVENFPKAHPVCDFIENERNSMTCQSTYTIKQDGRAGRCTILLTDQQRNSATKTAGEMEHKFISKMDCLSCEFFERCGLGCFLSNHFNGPSRTMNDCWLKSVHRKVESKRNAES